jgi:CheY-like chemotaxis protein
MSAANTRYKLPATVFVVDDDSTVLRRFAKESLRDTNLAVLTAEDLPSAVELLDAQGSIAAVLADIHFRPETHDLTRNMHSGLDFLKYVQEQMPDVPLYVMSMDAEDRASKRRAEDLELHVCAWYDKLQHASNHLTPWSSIERDLIRTALKSKEEFREAARRQIDDPAELLRDENVAEKVRKLFDYPRLTYLQYLPRHAPYRLKAPIKVQCWPENEQYVARAAGIPLLVEGHGQDAVEAVEDLADALVNEMQGFEADSAQRVSGYALFIKEQLEKYLAPEALST